MLGLIAGRELITRRGAGVVHVTRRSQSMWRHRFADSDAVGLPSQYSQTWLFRQTPKGIAVLLAVFCSFVFVVSLGVIGGCTAVLLRIRGAAPFLVAAGVCTAAACVAATTALSILSAWTRGAMLSLLFVTAIAAGVGWLWAGRPRPPRMPSVRGLRKLNGPTKIIVGLAVVTLLVQAYVGARVAPSNWDSMTYHLSRAAYWLQYQSIGQFPGASIRQAASAPDGELLQGLTMMMSGTDMWVQSVQWLALVGVALAVVSGARLLHFGRAESVFAACLFVVLPQPLMQSTTTQNDLIEAFFIASAAFFAVRALRDQTRGDMTVAALGFALAVGTKGTAFIAGTALVVLVLAAMTAYRPPVRFVLVSAGGVMLAVLALASYNYVLNVERRGGILGGLRSQTAAVGPLIPNALLSVGTLADSPGVDVGFLARLTQGATRTEAARLVPPVGPSTLDTSIQEDTSAFGLVGFLLLPACWSAFCLAEAKREADEC
jgi:Dolichyl-phosphate-mannose-protein mannosyltransferase